MEDQSGMATIKTAVDGRPGWPDLMRIALASALGAFTIRGGVGLAKLLGRRLARPVEPEEEEKTAPEERRQFMTRPGPAPKYASINMDKLATDGLSPLLFSSLAVGLGGGGAYAGWRLADWMADRRRVKELESDIDRKKKEYEKLLLGRPGLELRIPKIASCMNKFAQAYEEGGREAMEKTAKPGLWGGLPYILYATLAAVVANEARNAYRAAARASPIERELAAFRKRQRRRVAPARAVLSQPRQTQRESLTSATRLPELTYDKPTREEREEDPTKGR